MPAESNNSQLALSPIPQLLLSPAETAKVLRMSKSKLYDLWRNDPDNAPPSFYIGGNRYTYFETIKEWIAERERLARAPTARAN